MTNLMAKRFKVIADYPGRNVEIGDIITDPDYYERRGLQLKQYPHLFKELQWWEDRKPEDMPEYIRLKTAKPQTIAKVKDWSLDDEGSWWVSYKKHSHCWNMWAIEPATEQEYQSFKNSTP